MHGLTGVVGEHLHLYMSGAFDQFFDEEIAVPKGRLRLAAAALEGSVEFCVVANRTHTPTATAGGCFQHYGIADLSGDLNAGGGIWQLAMAARDDGNIESPSQFSGFWFVAEQCERVCRGSDESQLLGLTAAGEFSVFREKPVAGMYAIASRTLRHLDHGIDVEVGGHGVGHCTDLEALRSEPRVERECVRRRVDGDGFHSEFRGGARDTNRYLTPVADQYSLVQLHASLLAGAKGLYQLSVRRRLIVVE